MLRSIHCGMALAIIQTTLCTLPAFGQLTNEDFKLTASDGAANEWFGGSIAVDNGIVVLGAPGDNSGGISDSVYLFDTSTGTQLFKLLPNGAAESDKFGESVAIDNGIIAVGARWDNTNGQVSGSAYLFDASTGEQIFKLLPNDGAASDNFGKSIAIDNGVVAVGAWLDDDNGEISGSAYLFDASTGEQIFKLLPSDGAAGDYFGKSIAIDNGVVAVGTWGDDDNGHFSGSVYLFDATTGVQLFKLLPSDGAANDNFGGDSIAIDNGIIAIGAWRDDDNGTDSGSVYLFNAITGVEITKLFASDGAAGDFFGKSVAIDNGIVAVGAWRDNDNGTDSGSAFLFDASTGSQIAKLLPSDGAADDKFGVSITIDNGVVAVGAFNDDDAGIDSGSAYVFTVDPVCTADLTGDGVLNFFDVSAFLLAFTNNEPAADFTNDAHWNFFDVSAFLQAFSAGCP